MIGLLLLFALQDPSWQGIRLDGWTFHSESASGEALFFTLPAPGSRPRLWVRVETRQGFDSAYRSGRTLMEANCEDGSLRRVQTETFLLPNLAGPADQSQSGEWFYPGPGTYDEAAFNLICETPE
ncbi:surface-adhesin E family protein [Brevundimonas sp.]|uniref:surface-adhesin E family protein n=1 Tax=Brevundimonas sp. TaxID=1871086 RepID=UPI00351172EE